MDPTTLYPRLHSDRGHAIYRRDLGRHMFRTEPLAVEAADSPVTIPMLEDIHVQFARDREGAFDLVMESERQADEQWTDMGLIQQAFRNLKENLGEHIELDTLENGLVRIVSGGKYEASFLLLGNLWLQLEADYGANLYAAVPCPNLLLIAHHDNRTAIRELQEMIRGIFFEADRETLLSKAVYQRFDEEWKIVATAF